MIELLVFADDEAVQKAVAAHREGERRYILDPAGIEDPQRYVAMMTIIAFVQANPNLDKLQNLLKIYEQNKRREQPMLELVRD